MEKLGFEPRASEACSGSDGKESTCNAGELCSIPRVRKILWRREWQPNPVFLPGEFHGQRSRAGYSPWGGKKSGTTEPLTLSLSSDSRSFLLNHYPTGSPFPYRIYLEEKASPLIHTSNHGQYLPAYS